MELPLRVSQPARHNFVNLEEEGSWAINTVEEVYPWLRFENYYETVLNWLKLFRYGYLHVDKIVILYYPRNLVNTYEYRLGISSIIVCC